MKKLLIYLMFLMLLPVAGMAQSMSDDQVMSYIAKEHTAGKGNAQIVTQLMQRGVNIQQIRRVRDKYQKQMSQNTSHSYGSAGDPTGSSRMRTNNGKKRTSGNESAGSNSDLSAYSNYRISNDRDSSDKEDEALEYRDELGKMIPDTAAIVKQYYDNKKTKAHKVFGRDIFNNKELSFEPNMNIATPQNYRLGPGDAVIIDIYGASQKSEQCTVSPDGDVVIEGYGPVAVSGLTVAQANARLRSTLGSRYSSSRIKLTVGQTRTIMVNVMGEVKLPGTYTLSAFATVFHALYMAGGTNDIGTLRNIKVYRNNRLVTVVDIYDYILNGKLTGNVRLADNDVIVVGPYDCLVNISGKVKRPMFYEMKKNESVASLLKYSGSFTGDAYNKAVRVNRKTGKEYAVFNVGEFDFANFHIADGDSVMVDSIIPRYANTVEVKGAVFRPGMYNLGEQVNSVRSLIEHAEGTTEMAFTNRAVLHRMKEDRTLKVISVDLVGIMNGTTPDIPLQENDVLFVPTKTENIEQRTITIRGEVQFPGVYKYADNETIEDFVLQAGGLTDKASTVNVSVSRRVTDPKALAPDSVIAKLYTLSLKDGFVVDGEPGFTLMPFDEVYIRKSPAYMEQKNVSVEGEVMFAGTYTLSANNTRLSDLYRKSGGTNGLGYIRGARLMRRATEAEKQRMRTALQMEMEQQQKNILQLAASSNGANLQQAAEGAKNANLSKFNVPDEYPVGIDLELAIKNPGGDADMVLREGDRLIVPQYNGTVKVNGAVMYANTVAFEKGKRASYYIDQAGGYAGDAVKSRAYIIYMNGKVAKLSHGAKVQPGCEIVVPAKLKRKMSVAETMSLGSSLSSIAAMIATISNMTK
ncbi:MULTISPECIES: polysaccharide biosynthesis/export family protein [Prevotella]|uniref:polysaccharide biosynthesis/export family protein n=1 Tax=Prevotella merdae TaxID=2079531 RepID=UPI002E765B95|nr:SLBB domain-containing protein [Prevotella sp.]MEE0670987.1 SLBB domain-containing protein [Prevotella sp.]